ncbi:MAG: hypothetical protein MJZ93_02275 [Paludibacteraceae bacterium]|nr:hypothetical protein [Paludibacteraceae bacterium]
MENIYLTVCVEGQTCYMMASKRGADGKVTPIGVESEVLESDVVKCGVVMNENGLKLALSKLKGKMVNKLPNCEITGFYMGIECRSMRSREITAIHELDIRRYPRKNDLDMLEDIAANEAGKNLIAMYDVGYECDGVATSNITENLAKKIVKHSIAVNVAEKFHRDYVMFAPAGIEMYDVLPTPVHRAMVVTTEQQRIDGCLVVSVNSDCCSFTVLKNDKLAGMAVVPFGEEDLIHDFNNGKLSSAAAIGLMGKLNYKDKFQPKAFKVDGQQVIISEEMMEKLKCRLEEILTFGKKWVESIITWNEIRENVVITGKTVEFDGMKDLIGKMIDCVCHSANSSDVLSSNKYADERYYGLIGMAAFAKKNCVVETKVEVPVAEIVEQKDVNDSGEDNKKRRKKKGKSFRDFANQLLLNFPNEES